jgi:hypothetical protein
MRHDLLELIEQQRFTNVKLALDGCGIMVFRPEVRSVARRSGQRKPLTISIETRAPIPPREELPEDNAELANVAVELPPLAEDAPNSCPVPMEEIVNYLRLESPPGSQVTAQSLTFLRTAQVAEKRYWIWKFTELQGAECFVTVSITPEGESTIGYEENYHNLTPEQFMLGDYYELF